MKRAIQWTSGAYAVTILLSIYLIIICASIPKEAQTVPLLKLASWEIIEVSQDFLVSFTASLTQDVIFFGVLGIVTLLVFLSDPRDADLFTRISYLYSGRYCTRRVLEHIKEELIYLAAYASRCDLYVRIEAYDDETGAYRVSATYESGIDNMFLNDPYDGKFRVTVYPDNVKPKDDVLGAITDVNFSHYRGNGHPEKDRKVNAPILIDDVSTPLRQTFDYEIPPNSRVSYKYGFWQWAKYRRPFRLGVNRFTEDIKVTVVNACPTCEVPFSVDVIVDSEPTTVHHFEGALGPGEAHSPPGITAFKPGDHVQLLFFKPKEMTRSG